MRRQTFLTIQLLVLLIIFLGLLFFYITVSRPPQPKVRVPATKGIKYEYLFEILGYGKKPDELMQRPSGVAVDDRGYIYTTDTNNNRVLVFNGGGGFLFKFGSEKDPAVPYRHILEMPRDIAIDAQGNIYVSDILDRIRVFDSSGKHQRDIKITDPIFLAIKGGRLYASTADGVYVLDLRGNLLARWGGRGSDPGKFSFASGVAAGKQGRVYVSDSNNFRIQALDRRGNFLWQEGGSVAGGRRFDLPAGMTVDEQERIYVIDAFANLIRIFDHKGKFIGQAGQIGRGPGQLYLPSGITYGGNSIFYVADKFNDRIVALRISLGKEPTLTERIITIPILLPSLALLILLFLIIIALWRRRKRLAATPT